MANHAIVLLTYLVENPNCYQTYYSLEKATGIPRSTIRSLLNWDHYMSPDNGEPMFVWARNLGLNIEFIGKPGILVLVTRSTI